MTEQKEVAVGPTKETLHKRKMAMLILTGIFVLIAVIWLVYWLIWGQFEEYTDDAYVQGNLVLLMPQVPGTVIEVNADDTQLVTAGQVVIKLSDTDYSVAFERAKADLAQTVRQVRQYFENVQQIQQSLISNKASLLKAQLDFKRRTGLIGNRAVSREELQHYKTSMEAAEASYNASLYQLDAAMALVEHSHLYTHPLVETAKANLKIAYLNEQRTKIRAPVTGYVAKRAVQPGQQVSLNSAMLSIISLHDTWVDANFKESALKNLRINQPVTLYADAYPDVVYHGTVMGLNAGTGSAFALLPPQNATGNWIKIMQRLPVRIRLNEEELKKNPLQLGLSMRVTVDTHDQTGTRMAKTSTNDFKYETKVFENQLADVEPLIHKILVDNSTDMSLPNEKTS